VRLLYVYPGLKQWFECALSYIVNSSSAVAEAWISDHQLFVGVTGWLLDKLQSVQYAAARLVTGAENLTSQLWCANFTGYQSGKGSGLRQPFWSSSAFMDWLQHICLNTASQRLAIHTCYQPTYACCLFCTHKQPTVTGVSLPVDQSCGTDYLWRCDQVTSVTEETFRRHPKDISV